MKKREFLEKWGLSKLKLNLGFLETEFAPNDADREAAWELYVELLTRVGTQPLPSYEGTEQAALKSIYSLFSTTREILRRRGSGCGEFAKLAIPVLNQILRPFTAKWHLHESNGNLSSRDLANLFRSDLNALSTDLKHVAQSLADMAQIEDITNLEVAS